MTAFTAERGRVKVIVTSTLGSLVRVLCKHPSGRVRTVRGMDLASLSGGAFIGWDYEAPVNLSVTYTADIYADPDTLVASSSPAVVTWTTTEDWLKDPLLPSMNTPVRLMQPGDFSYETPSGVHTVLGRPDPIVRTTVRRAATGSFGFYTETEDERDRFHLITSTGNVLLLQSTQASGVGSMYIAPLTVSESPVSVRDDPSRVWTMTYQEVASPAGAASGFLTWNDVAAVYPTWKDISDAGFATWLDLFNSFADTQAQDTLAWRGA